MSARATGEVTPLAGSIVVTLPRISAQATGIHAQVGAIVAALPSLRAHAAGHLPAILKEEDLMLLSEILVPRKVVEEEEVGV